MLSSRTPPLHVQLICHRNAWCSTSRYCPARSHWKPRYCCPGQALRHGEDEIGSPVARPDRSLDGCRQPRISPVAGEKQVFPRRHRARPQRVLLRRGLECGAALAHDLPGRQLALDARGLADVPPDRPRQFLARHVHQPVGVADGDRQALRKREQPFNQAADDAEDRRLIRRRIEAEMRIDDGAEFRRRLQARQQRGGRSRRHRHHHGVAGLRAQSCRRRISVRRPGPPRSRTRAVRGRIECCRPCPAAA